MNAFLFRRIRGPVFLLCFALTAILNQWHVLSFARSWPLYLLAGGLLRVLEALLPVTYSAPGYPGAVPVRRRSVTLGAVEVLVGVMFLLWTTDQFSTNSFWRVYSTWWPLLLVGVGVLLLLERLLEGVQGRRYPGAYGAYMGPRRRRGGGLVTLVILLAVLGLISHQARFGHDNWGWDPDWNNNWSWNTDEETHTNDVSLQEPFAHGDSLTVENAHGDVQVTPSTDGMIHVDAHQVAHVKDSDKADAFSGARPVLEVHGGSATVTVPGRSGTQVDLVLAVPAAAACKISNHHGDISISGMNGALDVNQDHGNVAIDSAGGAVRLQMDHGDVRASTVAGDFAVNGRADDITLSGVKGRVQLHGDFFGDTEVSGANGPVEFSSNRTQLTAERLSGQLSLDSGELRVSGIAGGLLVKTRSKDVEVTGVSGAASIEDSNGDVTVAAASPLGTMTIVNNTGDVTLSVPPGAGFSLSGSTGKDDSIDSSFPLAQSTGGDGKTISGQVGAGGPHIELRTTHGDLTLHRGTDEMPEQPERPEKTTHMRHLESTSELPSPSVQ